MSERARRAIELAGVLFVAIALWPLLTAADARSPFEAVSLLLQFANLAGIGIGVFACGRWAGNMTAQHEALKARVDRIEGHEDQKGVV